MGTGDRYGPKLTEFSLRCPRTVHCILSSVPPFLLNTSKEHMRTHLDAHTLTNLSSMYFSFFCSRDWEGEGLTNRNKGVQRSGNLVKVIDALIHICRLHAYEVVGP